MKKFLSIVIFIILLTGCISTFAEESEWICTVCSTSNTTKFCTKCGTKRPDVIVCSQCGTQYPVDTDVVFCGECGTKLQQDADLPKYEGNGFNTPEDAALCYLAGIKNLNFDQILSAFAWETQVDHFDYKAHITRAKGTDPTYVPGMPAANALLRSAMLEQLRDEQINAICRAIELYVNDELLTSGRPTLMFKTEDEIEEYFQRCDNGKIENLATMENIRFYTSDDLTEGLFSSDKVQRNYLRQNAKYGADEIKDMIVAADIGENTIIIAPTVARYGAQWYLVNVFSTTQSILGIESNRNAFYVLPEDLKNRLKDSTAKTVVKDLPIYSESTTHYEGEGFNSPYDAVCCYFEGLKNNNMQQMLQAFAWETQASNYSLKDYLLWMRSLNFSSPIRMQATNAFMTDMNLGALRYLQSKRIYSSIRNYMLKDAMQYKDLLDGYRINLQTEEEIDAFIDAFNNGRINNLKDLHNIRTIDPATIIKHYDIDSVRKQLEKYKHIYGADEIKESLAIASLNGETLVFDPILARYGDKWYIVALNGIAFSILGIDINHQAFMTLDGSFELALLLLQP